MKKINWYYKFLLVVIIFFSMFFTFIKTTSNMVNSSSFKGYINYLSIPFTNIEKINIFKYNKVLKEKESLEKKLLKVKTDYSENENLKKEVERLKKLMSLEKTYTSYDKIYAKTIIRNKMYWYSTITIDKGESDNVAKGDAVITEKGLIGIVKSTNKKTSLIKLITSSDKNNKISVMIEDENSKKIGNIERYSYPYIIVSSTYNDIKEGERLVTSGLGNLPKDIYIGDVEKIKKDSYNLSSLIYVKPKQDMNEINYVAVLKLS